jgi:lipopolysaccharide transport system ATP-binding protein
LCAKTILLKNGSIQMIADTDQIIDLYLKDNSTEELKVQKRTGKIITDIIMPEISEIISDKLFSFSVCFDHTKLKLASLGYLIKDEVGRAILAANMHQYGQSLKIDREQNQIKVMIDKLPLAPGQYSLSLYLSNGAYDVEIIEDAVLFNVFWENDKIIAPKKVWGATYVETEWIY